MFELLNKFVITFFKFIDFFVHKSVFNKNPDLVLRARTMVICFLVSLPTASLFSAILYFNTSEPFYLQTLALVVSAFFVSVYILKKLGKVTLAGSVFANSIVLTLALSVNYDNSLISNSFKWFTLVNAFSFYAIGFKSSFITFLFTMGVGSYFLTKTKELGLKLPTTMNFDLYANNTILTFFIVNSILYLISYLYVHSKNLAREELNETQLSLNIASRFTTLGKIAGGIAHEINNPLSVIQGNIEIIKRQHASLPIEEFNQRLSTIQNHIKRIANLTKDLRMLSEPNNYSDIVMNESIESIIDKSVKFCKNRFLESSVILKKELSTSCYFLGNSYALTHVLMNLLNNSLDAIDGLNEKWIKVKTVLTDSDSGDFLEIYIIDSGKGIDAKIAEKIFEPFYTTKHAGEGEGIGLNVCLSILKSFNAQLSYEVWEGHTCFKIKLPTKFIAFTNDSVISRMSS